MEVCAVGMLIRGGKIFLGKRAHTRQNYPDVWDMPGGHLEDGETAAVALVRELREELGIEAESWREFATMALGDPSSPDVTLHLFVVTAWSGDLRNMQPGEHDELGWFTAEEASTLDLAHLSYPKLIRKAIEGMDEHEHRLE